MACELLVTVAQAEQTVVADRKRIVEALSVALERSPDPMLFRVTDERSVIRITPVRRLSEVIHESLLKISRLV